MPEPQDIAALREAAEAARVIFEPGWPRRDIDTEATCDGCAEFKHLVAAYDHPTGVSEPWLCADCAAQADFEAATSPDVVLALLSEVERGRALRAAVEALAERGELEIASLIRSAALIQPFGPNSRAVHDAGGAVHLTPAEAEAGARAVLDHLATLIAAHVPSPLLDGGAGEGDR